MIEFFESWTAGELWVLGAIVMLALELLIPTFFIGSFGASAFLAAGAAALGASLAWQIVIFGVVGAALVFPARKFFLKQSPELKMSVDEMVGKRGVCVEPIDGDLNPGVVRIAGTRWTALAAAGVVIAEGDHVSVVRRDGVKVVVAPAT